MTWGHVFIVASTPHSAFAGRGFFQRFHLPSEVISRLARLISPKPAPVSPPTRDVLSELDWLSQQYRKARPTHKARSPYSDRAKVLRHAILAAGPRG